MNCFRHPAIVAIGSCKACQKGLCHECVGERPYGLACRNSCETEVDELGEMNERGKKIYGIGKYQSRMPSSGVLLWGAFAAIFWGIAIALYVKSDELNFELVLPAAFCTVILGFTWYSSRRTGLKC